MDVILSVMNIVLGLVLAHVQFKFYRRNGYKWKWIKLLVGMMGLYWSGVYVIVTLARLGIVYPLDPVYFGKIFILPAITLTLGLAVAGGLVRGNYQ